MKYCFSIVLLLLALSAVGQTKKDAVDTATYKLKLTEKQSQRLQSLEQQRKQFLEQWEKAWEDAWDFTLDAHGYKKEEVEVIPKQDGIYVRRKTLNKQ